jgi:serine/threonine-protein kinase
MEDLFAHEAQCASRLKHPNLLGALESGTHEGWPYFTMSLESGGCLRDMPALSDLGRRQLFADLATALDHMHACGLLHCDLSPGNILARDPLALWLLGDFSAATPLGEAQSSVRGSFGYMSPEQVRRQPLNARSEVFSLAVVCWEILAGKRLFARAAQHLTLAAVVEDEAPPIESLSRDASKALSRALHKDPARRPASAGEFVAELLGGLT